MVPQRSMSGPTVQDMRTLVVFYRRLGLTISEGGEAAPPVEVKPHGG